MHEMSVIVQIMKVCLKHAESNNVKRIISIELKVGEMSDLEPKWMQKYFDHVGKGTLAEGAKLIIEKIPGPVVDDEGPLRMLVTTLDWSDYVGRIAVGRIESGKLVKGGTILRSTADGSLRPAKTTGLQVFDKLGRVDTDEATAGDIAAVSGIEPIEIGDTLCCSNDPQPLARLAVDEPTLSMVFGINTSPLAGRSGTFLTTRHLRERLLKELERNVALRVEPIAGTEQFSVSGRGLLHLSVLIETMRREGFELSVGKPRVILRQEESGLLEPFESLVVEVPQDKLGVTDRIKRPAKGLLVVQIGRYEFVYVHGSSPFLSVSASTPGCVAGVRRRGAQGCAGSDRVH